MKSRKKRGQPATIFLIALTVALILAASGCSSVSYLSQAVAGNFRIMRARVPIEKMLETNQLSAENKDKLKLVLEVRAYAGDELGLPKNKSYTLYSEISGQYLGWNVYVAPRFSVEPITWCFPVTGCVVYRGFFLKKKALVFAEKMDKKGFDVFIQPFSGYSTLGWYDDPVLSSQMGLDPIRLAGLVVHELAHQKFYVSGDSRFNEAFAVTVERAGVLQWLRSTGRDTFVVQALKMWDEEDLMASEILKARAVLMDLYANESDAASLSQGKDSIFRELKANLRRPSVDKTNRLQLDGEGFEPNNAYLVPIDTYYSLVPVFQGILDNLGGSLPQFYKQVEKLGKLPFGERQREIELLRKKYER
jgi:predicted aminopeptidase